MPCKQQFENWFRRSLLVGVLVATAVSFAGAQHRQHRFASTPAADVIPVTTNSAEARKLFEDGFAKLLNLHSEAALDTWRMAIKKDPNLALPRMLLSHFTHDPVEQRQQRERAKALAGRVSRPEKLVITWLASADEGHFLPAIAAMNDVSAMYPHDKRLAWLAGVWVENQLEWDDAIPFFERALRMDPRFAGALNEVAYCYAYTKQFDKAFAAMERYVAVLPGEPNPQDSYAEILRMAGHLDEALDHYQAALKIDPNFHESQLGLADTYALMGEEEAARKEYAVAIAHAYTPTDALMWSLQSAISYVHENDVAGADRAFLAVAQEAHAKALAVPEAEAYRMMALYQKDPASALELLSRAETALEEHPISVTPRDEERAQVLRVRVLRAAEADDSIAAGDALRQLQKMANTLQDGIVQLSYHGAAGAVLIAQGKYDEAISHLREDMTNPLSLRLLVTAYRKQGDTADADKIASELGGLNLPTIEAAVVVPEFRIMLEPRARFLPR